VAVKGFANGLAFASDGRFLLCAMGQEHRLGRWQRITGGAQNALAVVPLRVRAEGDKASSSKDEEEEE
jgi:ribosomal RNA-processing protein 9